MSEEGSIFFQKNSEKTLAAQNRPQKSGKNIVNKILKDPRQHAVNRLLKEIEN